MTTFRRLLGFLSPYRRGLADLVGAGERGDGDDASRCPRLTGAAVEAIKRGRARRPAPASAARAHERHVLLTLALRSCRRAGALGSHLLAAHDRRAGVAGRRVRPARRMYGQLQRLELGFFDHQQTGQLMSRATVDLQAVRFFLGYGLVFILQSVLTIALAGVVMIVDQPGARPDRARPGAVRGR